MSVDSTNSPANLGGSPQAGIATGMGAGVANGAASPGNGAPGPGFGAPGPAGTANGMYQLMSPEEQARTFRLRATYFRADQFSSAADCLTAAHAQGLPLDLCR